MPRPNNRLATEKSPYLLQHASNPVDWYPYGEEAFEKARREDKPIFLSIGYSTCHWCHVMERESFEDDATARLMNDLYVNIKVDREERPDVDRVYMRAVMMMQGQGGWPLNVWLTPDLRPFYGGTYFPPDGRFGRPAFTDVLQTLADHHRRRRDDVLKQADQLVAALKDRGRDAGLADGQDLPRDLAEKAVGDLLSLYEPGHGGFGAAPKFPQPCLLGLVAHRLARAPTPELTRVLSHTLECMWSGGLYDHVGGGFARYSTDDRWLVPHFEKMLYDNAQLVDAYVDGHLLLGRDDFAEVARDVLHFVEREMTHASGGFFSAQDADSEGEEGRFYVFTQDDLQAALGDDAEPAARLYGVTSSGNFEGANILHWPRSPVESAAMEGLAREEVMRRHSDYRQRLFRWREQRVRPGLDDKLLTSWNGLMIAALARAGAVLGEPAYITRAERAATFLSANLRGRDGRLLRRWRDGDARFDAGLDDYAFFAWGCFALFQATGRSHWLESTLELMKEIRARFSDEHAGTYYDAEPREDLLVRLKDLHDGALPGANGIVALLLTRVSSLLEDEQMRASAEALVGSVSPDLVQHSSAFPNLVCASTELAEGHRTVVITGDSEDPRFEALVRAAHRDLVPGRVIVPIPDSEREALERLGVPRPAEPAPEGGPLGFLCEEGACRPFETGPRP